MNRLRGLSAYLAGPIDDVDDDGVGWRNLITDRLQPFGLNIFDPCNKPSEISEIGEEKDKVMALKNTGDWQGLHEEMKKIVHIDLRMVQKSDFLIAYLPHVPGVRITGTIAEMTVALDNHIPVLVLAPSGPASVSNWIHGIIHPRDMFSTMGDLMKRLEEVDDGKEDDIDMNKWQFFKWDAVEYENNSK